MTMVNRSAPYFCLVVLQLAAWYPIFNSMITSFYVHSFSTTTTTTTIQTATQQSYYGHRQLPSRRNESNRFATKSIRRRHMTALTSSMTSNFAASMPSSVMSKTDTDAAATHEQQRQQEQQQQNQESKSTDVSLSVLNVSVNGSTDISSDRNDTTTNQTVDTDSFTISTSSGRNGGNNKNGNDDPKDDDDDNDSDDLLSYLGSPEVIARIPPQTQDLLRRITYNYIFGPPSIASITRTSLQEIATVIELEHRSRDVPLQMVDTTTTTTKSSSTNNNRKDNTDILFVADVTTSGEALDELCAEILSFGALYQLPKEIVLELLSSNIPLNGGGQSTIGVDTTSATSTTTAALDYSMNTQLASSIHKCRAVFAISGWDGVVFPMGLAIRPKTKFRSVWSFPLLRQTIRTSSDIMDTNRNPSVSTRKNQAKQNLPLSWFHRNKTLREIAAIAVQNAAKAIAPPRQLIDRRVYLKTLDEQIRQLTSPSSSTSVTKPDLPQRNKAALAVVTNTDGPNATFSESTDALPPLIPQQLATASGYILSTTSSSATGQLFFPNSDPRWWQKVISASSRRLTTIGNGIRTLRRTLAQQYNALKRQGRAGLIAYCLFNFIYYTVGMVWQWPRMPIIAGSSGSDVASNLLSSSSTLLSSSFLQHPQLTIPALLLRKFGKIFAHLYAFSQLLKIPKLCTAVGLAPISSKILDFVQERCNVKETSATIIMITAMILIWSIVISFPILSEYSSLTHMLYLEEQLLQGYGGIQPA